MVLDNLTAKDKFFLMLDWMMALEQRHADVLEPGLVHITLNPADVRELTYGASDAAQKLGEVLKCLQDAFRRTDVIARDGVNFLILTPFTQNDPVMDKVKLVLRTAPQMGLAIAQSNVKIFYLKDYLKLPGVEYESAQHFLDYLIQDSQGPLMA